METFTLVRGTKDGWEKVRDYGSDMDAARRGYHALRKAEPNNLIGVDASSWHRYYMLWRSDWEYQPDEE